MTNDYFLSWVIYLSAVVGAHLLLWRVLRVFTNHRWVNYLHCVLAAILLTPAAITLDGHDSYWAPAFMAALMDGLNHGFDAALPRLWSMLGVWVCFVVIALLLKVYCSQRLSKGLAQVDGEGE